MTFCNGTKGVVGTGDKKCPATSCLRWTNRWPISLFYSLIDKVCLNSFLIYIWNNEKEGLRSWRIFLRLLGKRTSEGRAWSMLAKKTKKLEYRRNCKILLGHVFQNWECSISTSRSFPRCPKRKSIWKDRKTNLYCWKFVKPICKKHHGPPTSKDFVVYKESVKENCKRKFLVLFLFQFFCLFLLSV